MTTEKVMEIHPNLQAAIDAWQDGPIVQARMVRAVYSAMEWPNEQHPQTVREFLEEHNIPIFDVPAGSHLDSSEVTKMRDDWLKERKKEARLVRH